jgi:outer membrane protein OmpA-like peptidoglycan-associated protein
MDMATAMDMATVHKTSTSKTILMKDLLLVAALLSSSALIAQKRTDTLIYPNEKVIVETDSTTTTLPGARFMYNSFWESWFVSVAAGGQVYFGDQDAMKSLGKRITATYEASFGKWVHPAVALRFKMGGGLVKGYSDGTLPSIGHSLITGTPDADGIYTQRWHQLYLQGDVLVDLSNAIAGYKRDRFYSSIVFIGAGIAYAQNQPKNDGDRTAMAEFGIINRFRLNKYFDANLEIQNHMVNQSYDREQSDKYYESFLGVTAGITYHFGEAGIWAFNKGAGSKVVIQRTTTHIPIIPVIHEREVVKMTDTVIRQETVREVMVEKKLVLTHPMAIFFELDRAEISDRAMVNLAFVADIIKSSGGARFRLVGSADKSTATPAHNKALSTKRCTAVKDYLVKVLIVDPNQLILDPVGGIDRFKSARVNRAVIISQE